MRNLAFTSTSKIANCNRTYTVNTLVDPGNFMSLTDNRGTPASIAAHTYSGVYYGIFYGNISNTSTTEYMLHYKSEGMTNGDWCLGLRVRPSSTNLMLEFVEGTYSNGANPQPTNLYTIQNVVPAPSGFCQVAWYLNSKPGKENTSAIWLNKSELPLASYPVGPAISKLLTTNTILGHGTPPGYKMATLWAGFDYAIEKTDFERVIDRWTGKIPYFMGRFGDLPLGGIPATTYINCSEETIRDRPAEGYYAPTGTVDFSYTYEFVRVPSIP